MVTKTEYKRLIVHEKATPTSEIFFRNKLNAQPDEMKEYYSVPFQATIYTKLRSFQFKINHNILYTKEKLHKIGMSNTPKCSFCKEHTESLNHLFVECKNTETLWKSVKQNLLEPYGVKHLTPCDIILGVIGNDKINNVINHIILEVKYYIYIYVV